jgi:CsoR family transcriptional regulator, copper-sensing transcriptional repressor
MSLCGADKKKYVNRISRIEGQLRGIKKMVETDRDCMDVLKQISAIIGAIRSLGMLILEEHIKGCVVGAIKKNESNDDLIHEVMEIKLL